MAHYNATKTHCVSGHLLSGDNLRVRLEGGRPRRVCITCSRAWARAKYRRARDAGIPIPKPHRSPESRRKNGRTYRAKHREHIRAYRRKLRQNPDYRRAEKLRDLYGMSLVDYKALLSAQGFCCAVCGASHGACFAIPATTFWGSRKITQTFLGRRLHMSTRIWTDRSRIEQFQRCARSRWLAYHECDLGITSASKPLPLAVGSSVHAGLAVLLQRGQEMWGQDPIVVGGADQYYRGMETEAVAAALADFAQYAGRLELATDEQVVLPDDPDLRRQMEGGKTAYDDYLYHEQAALIEGLVRGYARRRLRPLLEEYEVLEVEREGTWRLHGPELNEVVARTGDNMAEIVFMSRPDALLLNRRSRSLELLSYKTTGSWDVRKERDAQHDMQGLSEAIEVEQRLGEWWHQLHAGPPLVIRGEGWTADNRRMYDYLMDCAAPPRILAVRYEYILKGDRRKDKDASARFGFTVRTQSSLLTRAHLNAGMTAGDEQWNWSYDYIKEDGAPSKLYAKNWPGKAVWEHMTTRAWIDLLDATHMAVGEEGREMGWQGPAQASGFTAEHPLDSLFLAPIAVHRNDDELRDLVEQIEHQERRVAEGVAAVKAAGDEGEKRHLLNVHFPETRRACFYPSQCTFVPLCKGGETIRLDPMGSGLFVVREPHHTPELEVVRK